VVYSRIKRRLGETRSLTHNDRAEEVCGYEYKKPGTFLYDEMKEKRSKAMAFH